MARMTAILGDFDDWVPRLRLRHPSFASFAKQSGKRFWVAQRFSAAVYADHNARLQPLR